MNTPPANPKRLVRYFVSYAHADDKLPGKLLAELDKQLGACKDFDFKRWHDTDLLIGEKWHDEIQKAVLDCDFGLLLVSPAFLSSKYIGEHELPAFVSGEKPFMPVGLCRIDFKNQDTKGLHDLQVFLHATPNGKTRKCFADCSGKVAGDFAHSLFGRITAYLKKRFPSPPSLLPSKPAALEKTTNNLPRLAPFFGRKLELDTIAKALLPQTRTWGVLIDGVGGIGKTSLAIRAAEIAAPTFERVLFVSTKPQKLTPDGAVALANSIVPAYQEILNRFAFLLGLPDIAEKPEEERAGLIKAAIRSEKALLILDNLENLDKPQQNLVFEFVSDLPAGCKAIVTSRRRTDVDARIIRLGKLDQEAALDYLEELSADRDLLAKSSRDERLHLYGETGGNPLLLRWVVGQLGRGKCRSVDSALDLCRKASATNDPLEFIFGDLLETFSDNETKALAAVTYFTQKVAVKFIAEIADITKVAAQTALGDLANRALVMPDEADEHFALVPMVADFLKTARPEVVKEIGDRLEKRVYAVVKNASRHRDRFAKLEEIWPTIAAALPIFLQHDNVWLQTICNALREFFEVKGHPDERLALAQQAEGRAIEAGDFLNAGRRAYEAGWVHYFYKRPAEVIACARRATRHWQNVRTIVPERVNALRLLGLGYELCGDPNTASAVIHRAEELAKSFEKKGSRVDGNSRDLDRDSRKALHLARVADDPESIAAAVGNLATLALDRGYWKKAETLARKALPLSENVGRRELIASNSHRLAQALMHQDKPAEALRHARRAVEIYLDLNMSDLTEAQDTLDECEQAMEGEQE